MFVCLMKPFSVQIESVIKAKYKGTVMGRYSVCDKCIGQWWWCVCVDVYFLRTVMEWAKSHDFPTFQTAKMEETTFRDLKIKIGYPYLYCHQGDCEHVVIITDIRSAGIHCHTWYRPHSNTGELGSIRGGACISRITRNRAGWGQLWPTNTSSWP